MKDGQTKSPCGCSRGKNKTPLSYLGKKHRQTDAGTGLFAVPAPQKGTLEVEVVVVHDLTYSECTKRGHNCLAFKWVPLSVMSGSDIVKARASDDCIDYTCEEDNDCPGPCLACDDNSRCY